METQQDNLKEPGVDETGGATEPTILEVLNPDCWRLILDHLTINDLVRSERVSRGWQAVVLEYLQGVQNYRIEYVYQLYFGLYGRYANHRSITLRGNVFLFEAMIQKMGPFIVKMVVNYIDEEMLEAIGLNCPNLEDLTFYRAFRKVPFDHLKKCKQLKRVTFLSCNLREDYLNELVTTETLEELEINRSANVNGRFLAGLRTNLKALALNGCHFLSIGHVRSALDRLTGLKRLELNDNSTEVYESAHLLLDKMPNLESLSLMKYTTAATGILESITRLGRLRELRLWENDNVTDDWLAGVARGCPALRALNVGWCARVSGRAAAALCRALPALQELALDGLAVRDEELEACARSCRGLRRLRAPHCCELTRELPARLAWPRARALELWLHDSSLEHDVLVRQTTYEGLRLHWHETADPNREIYSVDYDSEPDYDNDYDNDYDRGHNSDYEFNCGDSDDEDRDWDDVVEEYLEDRDPNDA